MKRKKKNRLSETARRGKGTWSVFSPSVSPSYKQALGVGTIPAGSAEI